MYWDMVRMGLEKSLKKHHVLEKSLNFPQNSLNIFESSLNENSLLITKNVLRKGKIWKHSNM